ncbi:MAG: hypothetical protein P4M00_03445 [Azospirillaceae bacterium]|nr:hypothetical protein [Azospirillaceae bacterium]
MVPPRRAPAEESLTSGRGALTLLMSLFLVMLAVFATLVALSSMQKNRVRAVMASLDTAFAARGRGPLIRLPEIEASAILPGEGLPLFQRLGAQVGADIEGAHVDLAGNGAVLVLRLPIERLFDPEQAELLAVRAGLLDRLADALRQPPAGVRVDLQALIGINTAVGATLGHDLAVSRAAAFARTLFRRGVPADLIAAGLEHGQAGEIRLILSVHAAGGPHG